MTPDQLTKTEAALVEGYILEHRIVRVKCPECRQVTDFPVAKFSTGQRTYKYECPCGARFHVQLVGLRRGHRKRVKLAASCTRITQTSRIKTVCDVLDISETGMRVRMEFTKGLAVGDEVVIALVLDVGNRTRLELPSTVKRFTTATGHRGQVEVAVEFHYPLEPHQCDTLKRYVAS